MGPYVTSSLTIYCLFSLELNVGIIAACIPTLKPLFDPSTRRSWFSRGWSRKLTSDSGYRHNSAARHHLNNEIDLGNLPRPPPQSALGPYRHDTNYIEISGGRESYTSEEGNLCWSGGEDTGLGGAIRKKTEFTLQSVPFQGHRPSGDTRFE